MPRKAKKTTKATVKRTARVEPAMPEVKACKCDATCGCGCHHGKFKKFIVLLIVFLLGFAVAKITCCHCGRHMNKAPDAHPVFVNGCLDIESVKCPKMVEALKSADTDADECITIAEYKAVKSANMGSKKR